MAFQRNLCNISVKLKRAYLDFNENDTVCCDLIEPITPATVLMNRPFSSGKNV